MKLTIESTSEIVSADGVECRVWEGSTESGVKVQALIARVAVLADQDTAQFEAELQECKPPAAVSRAFPLRMIL